MSSDHVQLNVTPRTEFGTAKTRRLRAAGLVPGVLYKAGEPSIAFTLPERTLDRAIHGKHGRTAVFEISVDGQGAVPALLKDWDLNPVRGNLLHVDFQEVDLKQDVEANVPLILSGLAVGVRDGGVLGQPVHEVTVRSLPDVLPDSVEIDVSELQAGDVLYLSDVVAPPGVTLLDDPGLVVASVTAASRIEEVEVEEAAEAEPQIVGRADDEESE